MLSSPRCRTRLTRPAGCARVSLHGPAKPSRRSVQAAAKIRKVTGEELEVMLAERDRPMIIDFYADWCGPCVLLASELEKVADHFGDKVSICKVDTDDETALASQLQIQGLPTMVFVGMDPNKPALRTEGLLPFQSISEIINNELLQRSS